MVRSLLLAFVVALSISAICIKGTPWCVIFESDADANGGNLTITVTLDNGGTYTYEVLGIIPGYPAETKAAEFAAQADATAKLMASVDPDNPKKVKLEVQDDWPDDNDIKAIEVKVGDGQKINRVKDDPAGIVVEVVVDISGTGIGAAGGGAAEAVLGVGMGTLATVATPGKSGAQIEAELASAFNAIYSPTYTASLQAGKIHVASIPCEEGTVFGTDDDGLTYRHTTDRSTLTAVPALPWVPMGVLVGMVLAAAAVILRGRRA